MAQSSIEWTEFSWNPVTGCSKLSEGCRNCYAESMTRRLKAMGLEKYKDGFKIVRTHPITLSEPYEWKAPKMVFVNSMSDLFHPAVPVDFIKSVFKVMNDNKQHVFQVLTKRIDRALMISQELQWSENIWMGTSVENENVLYRIDSLKLLQAKTKFLSCEPLLGPLSGLDLNGIDWVIVGGESGHNPRPLKKEWVIEIKEQCDAFGVAFFFKQWGGKNKKKSGRELNGKLYSAMPKAF